MRGWLYAALLAGLALPGRADITVASPADLAASLAQAGAGEVLLLAAGDYGALTLTGDTRKVTLRSADPADPARFSGLDLRGVTGVTLQGLAFAYRYTPGDPLWTAPFAVTDSQDVTLRGCLFVGDVVRGGAAADDGHATGVGLSVEHAADLAIDGNRFTRFYRGLTVSDSDRVTVTGNDVSDIRSDGMDFVATQGLLVADNVLHDFQTAAGSEDHPDMIQFWTAGTTRPTRDVVIRDNVLNAGAGSWTQSILMGNEVVAQGQAGPEMRYRNIAITGNVILNAHLHGISVGQADGLRIAHNTLIHLARADGPEDNPDLWTPRINVDETSDQVTIEGNATAAIVGPEKRPDWVVRDNVLIQDRDPRAANHYDTVFAATGSAGFAYRPGGPVDGIRAGAPRLIAPKGMAALSAPVVESAPPVAQTPMPKDAVQRLSGARDFDLHLRLQRGDSADPSGEILRIHPMMVLSWQQNHGFALQLRMGDGTEATLQSRTPRLEAGRWYDLAVNYDAATGLLMLSVDGKLVARARATGPLASEVGDLSFGNPFGQKSFDGTVAGFALRANQTGVGP